MIYAVVSAEFAAEFQNYTKGVHMVIFKQIKTGQWAAPIIMTMIMPEIFTDYESREVMPVEFVEDELSDAE